ncbi:MAG: EAL domain-containing protein [Acidiferrobacter sp.]
MPIRNDDMEAYGPEACALLTAAQFYFPAVNRDLAETFYKELLGHAGPDDVMARLTPEEFWKTQKHSPLHHLLSPALKRGIHKTRAHKAGQNLALIGINGAWLADTYGRLLKRLSHHIHLWPGPPKDHALLRQTLSARLMTALSGQIAGHHRVLQDQQQAMGIVMRLLETPTTLSDLARDLLEALMGLNGMVAGTLSRPDAAGNLQFEVVVGNSFEAYASSFAAQQLIPSIYGDRPEGRGPSGRAWRSGHIQQSFSAFSDPDLVPWRRIAREFGHVSQASIPIMDMDGQTQGILALFHKSPGYFATPDRTNLLDQLSSALKTALTRLGHGGPVLRYTSRTNYRERLTQDGLTMLYQPVIDLTTGHLQKVEALARLQNPDGSYTPPSEFLPAFGAHELRQLFALGLRQALVDLRHWDTQGLTTAVAVNLPPQAITDPEYLAITRAILHEIPTDTRRLTLELLENDEIDPKYNPANILTEWRALGIRLAQDDLGSGYSSLHRMETLAVDDVKIDQGLVSAAALAPRKALQFIHHLTRLVHDLGIIVVVEGLETLGLIEAAAILGADAGQGYAIARPMAADALQSWAQHFRYTVDPHNPQTALGAYATLLLHNTLVSLVETRPTLIKSIIMEPCALSRYMDTKNFSDTPLDEAHREFLALTHKGANSPNYRRARQRLEDLLCLQIRVEETQCTQAHLISSDDNARHEPAHNTRKLLQPEQSRRLQKKRAAL